MKILIINYEYPPLGAGAGRQSQLLAEELSKRHDVTVLTSHCRGLSKAESVNDRLNIIRIPVGRKLFYRAHLPEIFFFMLFGALKAIGIAKKEKIDFVIAYFAVPSGMIAYILKRKFGIPYIVSFRGFDVPGFLPESLKALQSYSKPLIQLACHNSCRVIANSEYLADLARKSFLRTDMTVIPNAVEMKGFLREHTADNESDRVLRVLTVGRLAAQKGIGDLIKTVDSIGDAPRFQLDIVGDGPLMDELTKAARNSRMADRIFFHGWLQRDALHNLYRYADIFALLSIEEGMSNVLLEAISFGLPILATDIPANKGIVEDDVNGYLVRVGSAPEASCKLSALLKDKDLRERLGRESIKVAGKFGIENTARKYEEILTKCVKA